MTTILANRHGIISGMPKPSTRTARATTSYRRAQKQLGRARAELHAAIVADLRAGVSQAELARATELTRETIRVVARYAGLPPAR